MSIALFEPPELGTNTLSPRPYQLEAFLAARRALTEKRATCVVLPTGTGKTVLFGLISRSCVERGGRVLILAHRDELIDEAANTLERCGIPCAIEQADQYARSAFEPPVVVGSVATFKGKRLESWDARHFRMLIVDECHHATAKSYQKIIKHFHGAKLLGVTATPDRADDDKIANVFGLPCYEKTLVESILEKWLCPLIIERCESKVDLRGLSTTRKGDYNTADLEDRIKPIVTLLANEFARKLGDRQTIIFTPDCGSAGAMATSMQSLGIPTHYVFGDCKDRKQKLQDFKNGTTQVLVNCQVYTEGTNLPMARGIVPLRFTNSRTLMSQMIGRGTRIYPGKDNCLVLDVGCLTDRHDLARPTDLFDSYQMGDEEGAIIEELISAPGQHDLIDVVERAGKTQKEREILRIKAQKMNVKLRWVKYSPTEMADTLGLKVRTGGAYEADYEPATEAQVNLLTRRFKIGTEGLSKRRASQMIGQIMTRMKHVCDDGSPYATPGQVTWLIKMGIDPSVARSLSMQQASDRLEELFKRNPKN